MRTTVAALVVVAVLTTGCDDAGSACDRVDELQRRLDDTSASDHEYYEINDELNRAKAECNAE